MTRYSDEELRKEFHRALSMFSELPSSTEFREEIGINLLTYSRRYNLQGSVYIELLELYDVPQNQIAQLLKRVKELKSVSATKQLTGAYRITEEELVAEFRRVFDEYIEKYDTTPTVLEFQRLSEYGKNTLPYRLDMSYTEVAEHLGYEVDTSGSPVERVTLEGFRGILQCDYISQANFSWLKSDLNRRLYCDGYFKELDLVVEFDGKQHFAPVELFGGQKTFERVLANDAIKNQLLPEHDITLIRIAYDEPYWDEDFLCTRLYEHSIMPPNHMLLFDSASDSK